MGPPVAKSPKSSRRYFVRSWLTGARRAVVPEHHVMGYGRASRSYLADAGEQFNPWWNRGSRFILHWRRPPGVRRRTESQSPQAAAAGEEQRRCLGAPLES